MFEIAELRSWNYHIPLITKGITYAETDVCYGLMSCREPGAHAYTIFWKEKKIDLSGA